MRIVFFGMGGIFSHVVLKGLVEADISLEAIIIPVEPTDPTTGPRPLSPPQPRLTDLPILNPYLQPNIIQLAWERDIPVWQVGSLAGSAPLAFLTNLRPDLILVACFPFLIPPAWLNLPKYGCLNLHPSLLPAFRGPTPLFWQARYGMLRTGITLHFMDEGPDTGDIISQLAFDWPDGASLSQLDQLGAIAGAQLLVEAIQQLRQGISLSRQPQSAAGSSYFSFPTAADLSISTDWSAQRAFNFICAAAADWPLALELTEPAGSKKLLAVQSALSFDLDHTLDSTFAIYTDELWVQFNPGILRLKAWLG